MVHGRGFAMIVMCHILLLPSPRHIALSLTDQTLSPPRREHLPFQQPPLEFAPSSASEGGTSSAIEFASSDLAVVFPRQKPLPVLSDGRRERLSKPRPARSAALVLAEVNSRPARPFSSPRSSSSYPFTQVIRHSSLCPKSSRQFETTAQKT